MVYLHEKTCVCSPVLVCACVCICGGGCRVPRRLMVIRGWFRSLIVFLLCRFIAFIFWRRRSTRNEPNFLQSSLTQKVLLRVLPTSGIAAWLNRPKVKLSSISKEPEIGLSKWKCWSKIHLSLPSCPVIYHSQDPLNLIMRFSE